MKWTCGERRCVICWSLWGLVGYLAVYLLVIGLVSGCASTAPFTIHLCPGHPKAITGSDRKQHVCHLGDALGLWRGKQRQIVREGFH